MQFPLDFAIIPSSMHRCLYHTSQSQNNDMFKPSTTLQPQESLLIYKLKLSLRCGREGLALKLLSQAQKRFHQLSIADREVVQRISILHQSIYPESP